MRLLFSMALILGLHAGGNAQTAAFEKHGFAEGDNNMPYQLLLPANYDPSKNYPLIVFLHGAGERGNDNQSQLVHGSKLFLQQNIRDSFPAIVVFPQCATNDYWSNVTRDIDGVTGKTSFHFQQGGDASRSLSTVIKLIHYLMQTYPVEKQQVYVMGLSMGGMGTFELVRRMPGVFAAAVPICGGANTATAKQLRHCAWWIFHGEEDDVVPFHFSVDMTAALEKHNKRVVKFTPYPKTRHNSWNQAFAEPALMPWLFSQKKNP